MNWQKWKIIFLWNNIIWQRIINNHFPWPIYQQSRHATHCSPLTILHNDLVGKSLKSPLLHQQKSSTQNSQTVTTIPKPRTQCWPAHVQCSASIKYMQNRHLSNSLESGIVLLYLSMPGCTVNCYQQIECDVACQWWMASCRSRVAVTVVFSLVEGMSYI